MTYVALNHLQGELQKFIRRVVGLSIIQSLTLQFQITDILFEILW